MQGVAGLEHLDHVAGRYFCGLQLHNRLMHIVIERLTNAWNRFDLVLFEGRCQFPLYHRNACHQRLDRFIRMILGRCNQGAAQIVSDRQKIARKADSTVL